MKRKPVFRLTSPRLRQFLNLTGAKKCPLLSKLTKVSNNIFGVKGHGSPNYVEDWTHENINGKRVAVLDKFASYDSIDESIEQHSQFFMKNQRHSSFFNSSYPVEWAKGLQAKG